MELPPNSVLLPLPKQSSTRNTSTVPTSIFLFLFFSCNTPQRLDFDFWVLSYFSHNSLKPWYYYDNFSLTLIWLNNLYMLNFESINGIEMFELYLYRIIKKLKLIMIHDQCFNKESATIIWYEDNGFICRHHRKHCKWGSISPFDLTATIVVIAI